MRAPSEMRCRSIPKKLIATNTAASTSGIEIATTAPARRPRLTRLTPSTMATASHSASMNSSTACSTVTGWSATSVGSIPTGRFAVISAMACSTLCPRARTSPPLRMAMASPMPCSSIDAEHRLRRVGGPARDVRDVAQADDPAVRATKLTARMSCSDRNAPETRTRIFSSAGLHHARGRDGVLGLQRGDQRGAVDPEARQLLGRELDVDALVLRAEDVDLGDVRQLQQLLADVVDVVPQLPVGEAVRGEAVDDAVGVAELVVEAGADDALRQRVADVARPSCAPGTRCPAPAPAASSPSG